MTKTKNKDNRATVEAARKTGRSRIIASTIGAVAIIIVALLGIFFSNNERNNAETKQVKLNDALNTKDTSENFIITIEKPQINKEIEKGNYCADIKWRCVTSGYDSKTIIELATKLENTAKLDATKLNSTSIKFTPGLEKIVDSHSNMELSVSPELYDNLIAYCTQITILTRLIKENAFGNDYEILKQVKNELLRISTTFGTIRNNEVKKSEVINTTKQSVNKNNVFRPVATSYNIKVNVISDFENSILTIDNKESFSIPLTTISLKIDSGLHIFKVSKHNKVCEKKILVTSNNQNINLVCD